MQRQGVELLRAADPGQNVEPCAGVRPAPRNQASPNILSPSILSPSILGLNLDEAGRGSELMFKLQNKAAQAAVPPDEQKLVVLWLRKRYF